MRLLKTVLLPAAILLVSHLELLQARAPESNEVNVFDSRLIRSVTVKAANDEDRGFDGLLPSLKRIIVDLYSARMAAKAARKAKADAIKVTKLAIANVANFEHEADPTIKVMLQGLDKNLERQIAKLANGERGLDVFIGSKEYDEFVAAVRYCNGLQTTSKQFFIRPVLISMRRFGIKEVEEGIEKIKKSPEPRKRDLGRTLESQLITEKEIIKAKKIKETI